MRHDTWKPAPALRPFVDHFAIREAALGSVQIYHPLPARNDCFLEFYLDDPYCVVNVLTGETHRAPRTVLVGPHALRREDIIHTGTLKVFHIGFTPIGFTVLFGIPAHAIVNHAESAASVLGGAVHRLEDQLAASPSHQWGSIAEQFLFARMLAAQPSSGAVLAANVAHGLLRTPAGSPVARLASAHGRSVRHIERLFEHHVGLSPKLFSRIARLQTALKMTSGELHPDWSAIAQAAGYFDQSHMGRDFRALTGETPAGFKLLQGAFVPRRDHAGMSHSSYRLPW